MIGVIGINHQSAPVEIREMVAFSEEEVKSFLYNLKTRLPLKEVVMLSTCNRLEVYFSGKMDCAGDISREIIKLIISFKKAPGIGDSCFYKHTGEDAVLHLLKVSSGLDSMVIGENQILGQVKDAFKLSRRSNFTAAVLNKLFHKAFETGKKVRTGTDINKGASSISYAAVKLAQNLFHDLSAHPVLLIGAGETGTLVLQSLVKRGSREIYIANRSLDRAVSLAERYDATPLALDKIADYFNCCDIVISSTAATEHVIKYEDMVPVLEQRNGKPIFFIDLAVPRDIDKRIGTLDGASLYNIDDLEATVTRNYEKRKNEIKRAMNIVDEAASAFATWHSGLKLSPVIDSLKVKLNTLATTELRNLKNRLPDNEFHMVSEFSNALCKKYQGLIVKNLKELSENGEKIKYVDLVNRLFDLNKKV